MRSKPRTLIAAIIFLACAGLSAARAQSGGEYDLTWHTVDNGGTAFNTGSNYQLGGAIGQPDAGALSGGDYTLAGGFWQGETVVGSSYRVYLPLVLRQVP
jgi:hypothetical protein